MGIDRAIAPGVACGADQQKKFVEGICARDAWILATLKALERGLSDSEDASDAGGRGGLVREMERSFPDIPILS